MDTAFYRAELSSFLNGFISVLLSRNMTRQLITRLRKALRILCKILFNYLTCVKIKTYNEAFIVKDAVMLNVKLEQICNDVICNIFKLRVRPQLLLSSPGPKPLAPKTLKAKTKNQGGGPRAYTKILRATHQTLSKHLKKVF